jgi:hypothetical protein
MAKPGLTAATLARSRRTCSGLHHQSLALTEAWPAEAGHVTLRLGRNLRQFSWGNDRIGGTGLGGLGRIG